MTNPLVDILARGTQVSWAQGIVSSVEATTLTINWLGTLVPGVPFLASYGSPAVGDTVHMLLYGASGVLVLGKVAANPAAPVPVPVSPIDVDPYNSATYNATTKLWSANIGSQTLADSEVFVYYQAAFVGLAANTVGSAKIQLDVSPQSTMSTSLVLHGNRDLTGPLVPLSESENVVLVPGTMQWIDIPLFWADKLRTGAAAGIALTSAANTSSAVLATGGRLSFNLL